MLYIASICFATSVCCAVRGLEGGAASNFRIIRIFKVTRRGEFKDVVLFSRAEQRIYSRDLGGSKGCWVIWPS